MEKQQDRATAGFTVQKEAEAKLPTEFGPFRMDFEERLLLRDGQPVSLTPKAFETLATLVRRPGHLVEKDELLKAVAGRLKSNTRNCDLVARFGTVAVLQGRRGVFTFGQVLPVDDVNIWIVRQGGGQPVGQVVGVGAAPVEAGEHLLQERG